MHCCNNPLAPSLVNVPDGFKRAVSYEGQIHWLAGMYAPMLDFVDKADDYAERIEKAEKAATDAETVAADADAAAANAYTVATAAAAHADANEVRIKALEDGGTPSPGPTPTPGSYIPATAGAVVEAYLAADSVTVSKIKDANVTTAKLADTSVTEAKLATDSVTTAKIKDANVTTAKLADGSATEDKLASNSVTTAKIKDASVTAAKLKDVAYTDIEDAIGEPDFTPVKKVTDFLGNRRILCFGDSFGTAPDGWPKQLEALMSTNGTVTNFSVSGAGWGVSGNTAAMQVSAASGSITDAAEREDVYACVFVLGRNDVISKSEAESAVNSVLSSCKAAFPNARLICATHCWGYGIGTDSYSFSDILEAGYVEDAWRAQGGEVLTNARLWIRGNTAWVGADLKHPNAIGSRIIAGYILSGLNGTYAGRTASYSQQMGNQSDDVWMNYQLNGNTVTLSWNGTCSTIKSGLKLPDWGRPTTDSSGICYVSGGDMKIPLMSFNGNFQIFNVSPGTPIGGTGCTATWNV